SINLQAVDFEDFYHLLGETKTDSDDIVAMLTQLVLTMGKARTFDKILPPPFLGCFDGEKIAFVPYSELQHIFYLSDINWKVAPSNKDTREFKYIYSLIEKILNQTPWNTYIFDFEKDDKELRKFIKENFVIGKTETTKTKIDKNNFLTIYSKWLDTVKPTIAVDWDAAKKDGIIDGDFYLADLISSDNNTISENWHVLLKSKYYEFDKVKLKSGIFNVSRIDFNDNQKAYERFWAKYERPPEKEYWNYIVDRRDLIVPQDVRERKGSFYTPTIWVELSQKYLADVFGVDWQDEYYVWDCAAGTGNLLAGLTNKYNIWASTLDKQDLAAMKERIQNGANLLESHVFQFDFLNDDFSKLPNSLLDIINDPKLRQKLIIYINPPYAEATTTRTMYGTGENKAGVANLHKTKEQYKNYLKKASNELFAQFLIRIYFEIPNCIIANFSKLKNLQSDNFQEFRKVFQPKLEKLFVVPANSFENVNGQFPIGFFIWNCKIKKTFEKIKADIFDREGNSIGRKNIYANNDAFSINKWIKQFVDNNSYAIGFLPNPAPDFQNNNYLFITNEIGTRHVFYVPISIENLIPVSIYYAVRKSIPATWLNDRDQFLFPNKKWKKDIEFHNNCLAYTLFHNSNNISTTHGVNHWIPFSENEVNAKERFESHFMISFISGIVIPNAYSTLFEQEENKFCANREFSPEATNVFDAGRELWKYYHKQQNINVNAGLYDIREYFQGRNQKGKMNNKSKDNTYNALMEHLRTKLKILAKKIEPKVYEYGFLLK
ncbi:MAG: hypothetical protein FWH18_10395, partial [Marinilabiliaceae bacterium]|nr:hypothetical protein [Marinilabiliaceae bacterium]